VNKFLLLAAVLLLAQGAFAATLKGTVFDSHLQPVQAIVQINTTPTQTFVAQNGSFFFEVPKGFFKLTAAAGNKSVSETASVVSEGIFNVDMIVLGFESPPLTFPNVSEESGLENGGNNATAPPAQQTAAAPFDWGLVYAALFAIVAGALFFFHRELRKTLGEFTKLRKDVSRQNNHLHKTASRVPAAKPAAYSGLTDLQQKIMEELRKSDGRINQKELRKLIPFSEAKVSIELDFLEEKGLVKKFKKGRGNVIVLAEK